MPRSRMKAMPMSQAMKAAKPAAMTAAGSEGQLQMLQEPGQLQQHMLFLRRSW
jgi:hypothetical protein